MTQPKMKKVVKKIPSWPDGRWKKWYAVYSPKHGTIGDDIPDIKVAKTCAKELAKKNIGVEFRVVEIKSNGGWDTPWDDDEKVIYKHKVSGRMTL